MMVEQFTTIFILKGLVRSCTDHSWKIFEASAREEHPMNQQLLNLGSFDCTLLMD
jgi:hypothetical protein